MLLLMIRIPASMQKKEQVEQQLFILYRSYSKGDIAPDRTLLKVKCLFCFIHAAFLVRKAAGPNGITGRVLRSCADQLAGLFTSIFNESLATSVIPTSFKKSVIIPVPKNSKPSWPE